MKSAWNDVKVSLLVMMIVNCTVLILNVAFNVNSVVKRDFNVVQAFDKKKKLDTQDKPDGCNGLSTPLTLRPELKDCLYLYIDVGTNIGVQIRKLFEPHRYPQAAVLPIFNEHFGHERNKSSSLCAIGFEMNPRHTRRLQALEEHYNKNCGYKVQIFTEIAASVKDGEADFWTDGDEEHHEWGATTNFQALDTSKPNMRKHRVGSLDLSTFLLQALLPCAKHVVMKLDIEGSEHNVLPRLMLSGAFCKIDLLFLETHDWSYSPEQRTVVNVAKGLSPSFTSAAGCNTQVEYLDDESYLRDVDDSLDTC